MNQTRAYRSELREQQAERTRELIAASARACFLERGWSGTSVRAVAAGAGVSEATVYHVYGSKAGLASSLIDAAENRADVRQAVTELRDRTGDPARQLHAFVAFDRRLYELGGDVLRVMDEGRRQQPDLQRAYDEGRGRGDAQRKSIFSSWPQHAWRRGVTVDHALAVYTMIVSLDSYLVATGERGWNPAELELWWLTTLTELLLA